MEVAQLRSTHSTRLAHGEAPCHCDCIDAGDCTAASVRTGVDSNQWGLLLRSLGVLWIALGTVMTALGAIADQELRLSVWLWLGAACYAAYRFHTLRSASMPTERADVRLVPDAQWQRILADIERRRTRPRNVHELAPRTRTLQQYRDRFAWQHQQGRLSDAGLRHRLATVDALAAGLDPPGSSWHRR